VIKITNNVKNFTIGGWGGGEADGVTERRVAEDAGGTGRAVKAGRCGGVRLLTGGGGERWTRVMV